MAVLKWHILSSVYRVINFRGIQPVLISSIWDIKILPGIQYFIWLLGKNKLLTRDKLLVFSAMK